MEEYNNKKYGVIDDFDDELRKMKRNNILRLNEDFKKHASKNQWSWPSRKERGYSYRHNPYDFFREVYGKWIGQMTGNDLKALDEPLWWAIQNRKRMQPLPDDITFLSEADAALSEVEDAQRRETIGKIRKLEREKKRLQRSLTNE